MKHDNSIFHYTSIETLALILATRKIRFNSLNNVDDLTEAITADPNGIRNFTLVSCWTDDPFENIALWKMYSKSGTGCRIKMSPSLFFDSLNDESKDFYVLENGVDLLYPMKNGFKIKYVNKLSKFKVLIEDGENGENGSIDISKIGKYKGKHWRFQREVRFIIYQFLDLLNNSDKSTKLLTNNNFKSFYDLGISQNEFEKMEILLGPEATEGQKIICQSLIDKYNPKTKLVESSLKGKIKMH
jgi:hypothetical protein